MHRLRVGADPAANGNARQDHTGFCCGSLGYLTRPLAAKVVPTLTGRSATCTPATASLPVTANSSLSAYSPPLGGCEPQLDVHINAALNVGLAPDEIVEALLHSAVYCGMPKALNATFVAKKVFSERNLLPVTAP